jgi:hypothetical protein
MLNKMHDIGEAVNRMPQVTEQVQRMEKAIARLGEVREQTENRLGAILTPPVPCGVAPGKDKPMAVPLAQELERLTEQINGLTNCMESMLSRVEL